ncbi:MAG: alpha/beta fold hydrolase, partial [Cyanothece sp. SIO1E1]|nr:alpha/beta fold hydrolase [Cyanothece sp. SIO1E1]
MQLSTQSETGVGSYWQWRGQSIHFVQVGERHPQRPPLLLVHGFGASTDHWRKNMTGLQDNFEVWAIDLLGFGRSAKPNWQYTGDLWRDQLHDFISEMMGQPAILAGNSLGGYASLCVAAQRPESVAGLVLLNSAGPFSETGPVPKPNPIKQAWNRVMRLVLLQPLPSFLLFQYVPIVRTVLLRSRKKAVHRYRVRLQQNQVAPMDSFSGILTGLLET